MHPKYLAESSVNPNNQRVLSFYQTGKITTKTHEAEGFLSFVDCSRGIQVSPRENNASKSSMNLFQAYGILLDMFPSLPREMLTTLIIQESGNTQEVARSLIYRGWGKRARVTRELPSKSDHFTLPYFWGEFKEAYYEDVKKAPCGSYFTAFRYPANYLVIFKKSSGLVTEKEIDSPQITDLHELVFNLDKPLHRPACIPLRKLIPTKLPRLPTTLFLHNNKK